MVTARTLIVVTYNSAHVIEDLLSSIPAALDGVPADVVIVDNGSTDDTLAIVEGRSDCEVVRSTNGGYAAGINRGIKERPAADAFLVLNPDVRLHAGSARLLFAALDRPKIGITSPKILNPDGSLHFSLRREPSIPRTLGLTGTRMNVFAEYLNRPADYAESAVVDWALGAVLAFSKDCFDAVGGWDESFFLYSEETDFCLRARDHGWLTEYVPNAVATHIGGQSGQSVTTHVMQIVNRVRLYRRRHAAVPALVYLLLTGLREATWIRRGGPRHVAAITALVRPSRRPPQLACSSTLLPK